VVCESCPLKPVHLSRHKSPGISRLGFRPVCVNMRVGRAGVCAYLLNSDEVNFDPEEVPGRSWGPTVGRRRLLATYGMCVDLWDGCGQGCTPE